MTTADYSNDKHSKDFHRTIPLAYGALLLMLGLVKAKEHWKLNGFSGSRLVLVLIGDQGLYYAV